MGWLCINVWKRNLDAELTSMSKDQDHVKFENVSRSIIRGQILQVRTEILIGNKPVGCMSTRTVVNVKMNKSQSSYLNCSLY